ncbi:MAG: hypothetical protein FWC79_07375 [Oscillospiraceae bacterium]|nr:hypothetical protein [Oscillospiraceae bacterium]
MSYIIKYSIYAVVFFVGFILLSWVLLGEVNFITNSIFTAAWVLLRIGNDFIPERRKDEE